MPELIADMSEPVNSVTMKVLQPLWNQSSPRTNNCLAYSNYSYSGIGPKECTLNRIRSFLNEGIINTCYVRNYSNQMSQVGALSCMSLGFLP